jgi:hypothetical protein
VCPAQITAGAPQNAVGPQVAEKPVGAVGRDLGYRAQQSRVAAGGRRVLGGARRLEVLDLNKDTVVSVVCQNKLVAGPWATWLAPRWSSPTAWRGTQQRVRRRRAATATLHM